MLGPACPLTPTSSHPPPRSKYTGSFQVLKHAKPLLTSGPLHQLFPLPARRCPQVFTPLSASSILGSEHMWAYSREGPSLTTQPRAHLISTLNPCLPSTPHRPHPLRLLHPITTSLFVSGIQPRFKLRISMFFLISLVIKRTVKLMTVHLLKCPGYLCYGVSLSVFLVWLFLHDQMQVKHFGGEDLTWGEHNIGNAMFSHCIPSGSKHIVSGGSTSGSAAFDHLIGGVCQSLHCAGTCAFYH